MDQEKSAKIAKHLSYVVIYDGNTYQRYNTTWLTRVQRYLSKIMQCEIEKKPNVDINTIGAVLSQVHRAIQTMSDEQCDNQSLKGLMNESQAGCALLLAIVEEKITLLQNIEARRKDNQGNSSWQAAVNQLTLLLSGSGK